MPNSYANLRSKMKEEEIPTMTSIIIFGTFVLCDIALQVLVLLISSQR